MTFFLTIACGYLAQRLQTWTSYWPQHAVTHSAERAQIIHVTVWCMMHKWASRDTVCKGKAPVRDALPSPWTNWLMVSQCVVLWIAQLHAMRNALKNAPKNALRNARRNAMRNTIWNAMLNASRNALRNALINEIKIQWEMQWNMQWEMHREMHWEIHWEMQ